jgi:hypothetical protein
VRRDSSIGGFAGALILGLCASCPFELPRGLSCGDGWWDTEFEECDPADPRGSHLDACRDQGYLVDARCDPTTCEIVADVEQCNTCGDGVRAGDEACDGYDLPDDARCPGQLPGTVRCTADCTLDFDDCPSECGNGLLDPGEECDPMLACETDADCPAASPVCHPELFECMRADVLGQADDACQGYPVTAWDDGGKASYGEHGRVGRCTDDCVFDRTDCNFCGDGVLDGAYGDLGWPDIVETQDAELCDGVADPETLSQRCFELCGVDPVPGAVLRCGYSGCAPDCSEPLFAGFNFSECCVVSGVACPPNDLVGLDCCYWHDNPGTEPMCGFDPIVGQGCL